MIEFFGLALLLIAASLLLGWRRAPIESNPWDLRAISANYTVLTITLAGFTVASVFFLAAEGPNADSQSFAIIAGILLLAYMILTGAAMMFGTIAHAGADLVQAELERVSFCFATIVLLQGVAAAWIAVHPLLILVDLAYLAHTFSWILVLALFVGSSRPGVFLHRLAGLSGRVVIGTPLLGFGGALAYDLIHLAAGSSPDVVGQVKLFGVTLFLLALLGFAVPPLLHLALGKHQMASFREAWSHRIVSVYYQLTVLTIALLLAAVAFPGA